MKAAAKPATFDVAAKDRRLMIAKIHVAKKEMALSDEDYRAVLLQATGRVSSADCSLGELRAMLDVMKSKGFRPKKAERVADHPVANKARALWISLYHLGAIDNPSEQALEAFARRQLKVARLQWANQALCYKLVEALKAIAQRNGWDQKFVQAGGFRPIKADVQLRVLKVRLVERLQQLLIEHADVPVTWTLKDFAFRLAGMERDDPVPFWSFDDLDMLAKSLGEKLRRARR